MLRNCGPETCHTAAVLKMFELKNPGYRKLLLVESGNVVRYQRSPRKLLTTTVVAILSEVTNHFFFTSDHYHFSWLSDTYFLKTYLLCVGRDILGKESLQ